MRSLPNLMLGATALATLAACAITDPLPSAPPAVRSPAATAEPVTLVHHVAFTAGEAVLAPGEAQRLQEFLATLPRLETGRPALLARTTAGRGDLASRRIGAVEGAARRSGFGDVAAEILPQGSGTVDAVEVVATTWTVRLPHCPDWSRDLTFDARNLPLSDLGCATATNLGLMVADPADLPAGRPLGPADGTREADAILRYRTDKVRPLDQDVLTQ